MIEQCNFDLFWNSHILQGFLEDLAAPGELPPHDWVILVHLAERPARILYRRAEEFRRQLIFHLLDTRPVGVAKKEADHAIGEHTIDKAIDDLPQPRFTAEALE